MKNLLENLRVNVVGSVAIGSVAIEKVNHVRYGEMEVYVPYVEMDVEHAAFLKDWTVELSSDRLERLVSYASYQTVCIVSDKIVLNELNSFKSDQLIVCDGLQYHLLQSKRRRQWIEFLTILKKWLVKFKDQATYNEIENKLAYYSFAYLSDEEDRDFAHELLLDVQGSLSHELKDGLIYDYRNEHERLEIAINTWMQKYNVWSFDAYEDYLHSLGDFVVWDGSLYVSIDTVELCEALIHAIDNDLGKVGA